MRRFADLRRMLPILSASTLGTAIGWFDFFFYGMLSVSILPAVFFPQLDPFVATFAAFSTNFIGFVARPLGGAFFGWVGDRTGRTATLAMTLLFTGIATMLMGVLPGYAVIGPAAPVLLALCRFLQGVGLGGEWGGSILLSMEYGDDRRRGFWASWPQTGVPVGLALSALSILLFKSLFPGEAFTSVGWRIPFLQSSMLLLLGLYIRLRIQETPAFTRVKQEQDIAKSPLLEVVRSRWRTILLCTLLRSGETAPFYIFTVFVLPYGVQTLLIDPNLLYTGLALASLVSFILIPISGLISDRVGRKRWYMLGMVFMAAFALPYFLLLRTNNPLLVLLALVCSVGIAISWVYGPEAALICEQFRTRHRYSGAALGYQLASITAGGPAPIIATYVLQNYTIVDGLPTYLVISFYIVGMALVSFVATSLVGEWTGKPLPEKD
ncbi:MAG: MHS family MFS transporter [Ktedonobacteraceae bacterium]|nr:MHS family MFS transporter [Ktedonobacteraceae bacterium]